MKTKKELRPMYFPNGVEIKEGQKIYDVYTKTVSSYSYQGKDSIRAKSGAVRAYIVESKVVKVNPSEGQRSFVIQSDRGCETVYSLKGGCLPDFITDRKTAVKKVRKVCLSDITELTKANKKDEDYIKRQVKNHKEKKALRLKTIALIKANAKKVE